MNIIQVSGAEAKIPVDKGGGIESFIFAISKQLVKMGHNVTILDRKYAKTDPTTEDIDGIKIVRLSAPRFNFIVFKSIPKLTSFLSIASHVLNQFTFAVQLGKYLRRAKDSDVVHMHVSPSSFILALISRDMRKKLFFTSHSNRVLNESWKLRDRISFMPQSWLAKWARRVTASSELMRAKFIEKANVSPEKVVVIPYDVDTSTFTPDLDVSEVKQRYQLEGKRDILCVARISPEKGLEYLVRAANITVNEFGYKDAHFLLVGPLGFTVGEDQAHASYYAEILSLIESLGLQKSIKLTGAVPFDDLRKLYAACNIFVLPSLAEALPKAVLEAMACGKPVIGTRVGGIPVEVEDGRSGFLIDPADERQIAKKIKYLIDAPVEAKMMGAYGRRIVEEKFDSGKIAERFLQVYQSQQARQNKQAEINLSERELIEGTWEDSDLQREDRRKQLELLQPILSQSQLILDAGCGPGTYGLILAQQGNKVVGIDISPKTVGVAKNRADEASVSFLPIAGDLERLPFKDSSFDMCFCGYTLHHFPDIGITVTELARALKPGGRIVVAEPNGSSPAVRLSNALENLLQGWLVRLGVDTPNEALHNHRVYVKALEQSGITDIKVDSCYFGGLPPLPKKSKKASSLSLSLIHILARLRRFFFIIAARVLPRPLNGSDLLITGTKGERQIR